MPYLLTILGIVLIGLNIKSIILSSREDKTFNNVLKNAKENINDNDIALGEIRREFAETILEIQKEIISLRENDEKVKESYKENISLDENLKEVKFNIIENSRNLEEVILDKDAMNTRISKNMFNHVNDNENIDENESNKLDGEKELIFDDSDKMYNQNTEVEYTPLKNDKNSKVNELIEQGFSIEEISEMLSIGKGEILLIKELLKNLKKD